VSVKVPRVVPIVVRMVSVRLPGTASGVVDHAAVDRYGSPLTVSETEPVKPFTGDTVTVYEVEFGRVTVREAGLTDTAMSRGGTTTVTAAEWLRPPPVPVTVTG
jgi:hypothetical protein